MVAEGWITGMTSNPTIFDKAISESGDYEEALQAIIGMGEADPYDAFVALAAEDIRLAAGALRPVYEATAAADGHVSLEVPPGIEHDREATVAEALRLFRLVDRPNVMIKVPGTPAGVEALTELIAAGVNVNVTLLFSVAVYERVAEAYLAGLERRLEAGEPLDAIASVASFFVSPRRYRRGRAAAGGLAPARAHRRRQCAPRLRPLPRHLRGRALGATGGGGGAPPAPPLGLDRHEEPRLLRHALRRDARLPRHREHAAAGHPRRRARPPGGRARAAGSAGRGGPPARRGGGGGHRPGGRHGQAARGRARLLRGQLPGAHGAA